VAPHGVAEVIGDDTDNTIGLIRVRAPVLLPTDGRRFRVKQAAYYDVRGRRNSRHTNTPANHAAAQLENIRQAYGPQPATSSTDHGG
jgi:hypothetical protein